MTALEIGLVAFVALAILIAVVVWWSGREKPKPAPMPPPSTPQAIEVQQASKLSSTRPLQQKDPPVLVSDKCPHGRRRREYCPICDPDGYRQNFGDWQTD